MVAAADQVELVTVTGPLSERSNVPLERLIDSLTRGDGQSEPFRLETQVRAILTFEEAAEVLHPSAGARDLTGGDCDLASGEVEFDEFVAIPTFGEDAFSFLTRAIVERAFQGPARLEPPAGDEARPERRVVLGSRCGRS